MARQQRDPSRRARRRKADPDPGQLNSGEQVDDQLSDEEAELVALANPAQRLRDWLTRSEVPADCELDVSLYKYNSPSEGRAKAFCWRGTDILDEVEIGRRWGSGRYLQIVIVPRGPDGKRKITSVTFYLHESFDRGASAQQAQPGAPDGSTSAISSAMELVRNVVSLMLPLVAAQRQNTPADNFGAIMLKQYDLMGQAMSKNMLDTQRMMRQTMMRDRRYEPEEPEEGEEGEESTPAAAPDSALSQVIALAQEWLPKLIGKTPEADMLATVVKTSPQFAAIRSDAVRYSRLVSALDAEHGPEIVDQLLTKLGLARPGR